MVGSTLMIDGTSVSDLPRDEGKQDINDSCSSEGFCPLTLDIVHRHVFFEVKYPYLFSFGGYQT